MEKGLNMNFHHKREGKYERGSMENENFSNQQFDAPRISDENGSGLKNWRMIVISMVNIPQKMSVSEFSNSLVYKCDQLQLKLDFVRKVNHFPPPIIRMQNDSIAPIFQPS
jgi:hypothetical protein